MTDNNTEVNFMNNTNKEDMQLSETLLEPLFRDPERFPVTFILDDVIYHGLPQNTDVRVRILDANMLGYDFTATLHGLVITAECVLYKDFAAAEWTVYFKNNGTSASPLLSDVATDIFFAGTNPVLSHCNGDYCSPDGYTVSETALPEGVSFAQEPDGGRPCDRAFPYQRLLLDGYGLNIAIGWPGQWFCEYAGVKDGICLKAGQKTLHTVLEPGETLRTPRISVVAFEGDISRGINVWRRWYNAHVLPKAHGQPVKSFMPSSRSGGGQEFTLATEQLQTEGIEDYISHGIPINLWWIDAGWYPAVMPNGEIQWWSTTGTWECDRNRFPDGFAPVGEKCREKGIDFLVWFEPERVNYKTKTAREHPEWLLFNSDARPGEDDSNPANYSIMLNMGDKACVKWLGETMAAFLRINGITVYRQDFNFAPLSYWRYNDAENRGGMTENKYIQGYLAYLDYLLTHVPNLVIDSCASGGRRNDLESMRRAVPLHQTDSSYGVHPVKLAFYETLYTWIPYFRGFSGDWEDEDGGYDKPPYRTAAQTVDSYNLYSSFAPCMSLGGLLPAYRDDDEKLALVQKITRIYHTVAPALRTGDFYPLTPPGRSRDIWVAWQFDEPEKGTGLLEIIRHNAAPQNSQIIFPKALEKGTWLFEDTETEERFTVEGSDIQTRGLTFSQPLRSITVWRYRRT